MSLLRLSLRDPAEAGARLLMRLPGAVVAWQGLVLVICLSVVLTALVPPAAPP